MSNKEKLFSDFPPVSHKEWEDKIAHDLKGADYKTKLKWHTGEGVGVLPFYRRDNFESLPAPVLSESNAWEIRQPITEQEITKANKIAQKTLQNGADALTFQLEIQSTEGMLGGDLRGTAIQNQEAFGQLLNGIAISEIPLHFEAGLASPVLLAMLHDEIEDQGIDSSKVNGSILFDPYAFIITHGQLPKNEPSFIDETKQIVDFCAQRLPGIRSLGVDARIYHQAGGTIAQELGYALAAGSEYLAALSEAGLDTDTVASAIHFNFSIGSMYFLEIAKFRAVRRLWRKVLDAYEVDESHTTYVHGSSSTWNKTMYDPYVNMLRTTTEGMSAAIAGCDSITLHPFDDPFRQPDDFGRRIARNSQIILKEEAYFNKVGDPAAGSYYIETLTDKLAEAAWQCFKEVEEQGGLLKSIRGGYVQTAIEDARQEKDRVIASRKRILVGVNQYPNTSDAAPETESRPTVSLKESGEKTTIDSSRLMASLKKALKNGAVLGDIIPALFEFTKLEVRMLRPYRGVQAFEALRRATEQHSSTPSVLTLPLGNKKMRKARSSFAVNFLGCAGYEIEDPIGFDSVNDAIAEIKKQQPDIVVLCSSDEEYQKLVPELGDKLENLNSKPITVLTGYPKEHIAEYREAGIDLFIHAKCNVLETLKDFQKQLGIN